MSKMKTAGFIARNKGSSLYSGPALTDQEINDAIGRALLLDDLRIRRQWRMLGPQKPKPVRDLANAVHLRAHKQWESGKHRSAFRLMLSAAKLGDTRAMLNLGYFYDVGIGVKKNRAAAMNWYKRASRRGDECAANNIGVMYRFEGKPKRALYWFGKSVARGDVDANFEIARVCIEDLNNPKAAEPFLKRVAKAKPRVNVTEHAWGEAKLLLEGIGASEKKRKPIRHL